MTPTGFLRMGMQAGLQFGLHALRRGLAVEHRVAARDIGLDPREPRVERIGLQLGHRQGAGSADIDGPQQGEDPGEGFTFVRSGSVMLDVGVAHRAAELVVFRLEIGGEVGAALGHRMERLHLWALPRIAGDSEASLNQPATRDITSPEVFAVTNTAYQTSIS